MMTYTRSELSIDRAPVVRTPDGIFTGWTATFEIFGQEPREEYNVTRGNFEDTVNAAYAYADRLIAELNAA